MARLLGARRRRRRGPEHEKPGMGALFWEEKKDESERYMAGHDATPPHLRELIRSAGNIGDAVHLWTQGIRTYEEAEAYIAKSKFEKPKRKRITEPTYIFQE